MTNSDETKKYQKAAEMAAYFANLKFSRSDEFEADSCSVDYLVKAGYDPNGARAGPVGGGGDAGHTGLQ